MATLACVQALIYMIGVLAQFVVCLVLFSPLTLRGDFSCLSLTWSQAFLWTTFFAKPLRCQWFWARIAVFFVPLASGKRN